MPGAWDELFTKLLGRTPPDLAHGCLQDIHWAAGLMGYFPNYAMGSMLAAQLFERATADGPDILPALGRGDFGPYFAWVKPRVHERASLTGFDDPGPRSHRRRPQRRRLQAPRQRSATWKRPRLRF